MSVEHAPQRAVARAGPDHRAVAALTEQFVVRPVAPRIYDVSSTTEDSRLKATYRVDLEEDRCECADVRYNHPPDGRCKHLRAARFHEGVEAIPAWVNRDALAPGLRPRYDRQHGRRDGDD